MTFVTHNNYYSRVMFRKKSRCNQQGTWKIEITRAAEALCVLMVPSFGIRTMSLLYPQATHARVCDTSFLYRAAPMRYQFFAGCTYLMIIFSLFLHAVHKERASFYNVGQLDLFHNSFNIIFFAIIRSFYRDNN